MPPLLITEDLSASYGPIKALQNLNFEVGEREIVTIIGANGAGKTTLLNCLSGLMRFSGKIIYAGETYTGIINSSRIVKRGVVQVPEGRQIFSQLSVLDNMRMGAYSRSAKDNTNQIMDEMFKTFPRIGERKHQQGGSLSGGEQQMLAFARALMAKPKLLLLDEPSMGLAPVVVATIFEYITKMRNDGITILLIEQNAKLALKVSDRAYVIENGKIEMSGNSKEIAEDPKIKAVYLGG
jgi:branched-chain amino acid transport system ATP-binding protein